MNGSHVWPTVLLGELLTNIQPGFASGRHNSDGEGLPHLRPMNVSIGGKIDRSVVKFIEPDLADRPAKRLRKGDVLFNNTNSPELVGKTALFDGDDEPAFSNHMTRLRVDPTKLDPGYLALRLHQAWREGWFAAHCNNHVSQASIGRGVIEAFEIQLPPLEVQCQVVRLSSVVESHRVASLTHLGKATKSMEGFRQAVLAAACSGRLTSDWREASRSITSAGELIAAIDELRRRRLGRRYQAPARLTNPGESSNLPDGWSWTTIGSLVDVATGATPLRKRIDYYDGAISWVTSGAVNAGLITKSTEYITELALKETNAKVFPTGTLLVAMYGEGQTRGRVAELGIDAATNQALAALLFDDHSERLRPYLHLFLLENYERVRQISFGGVQPNLSLGVIRDTVLPLPPVEEQAEIVRRVAQLLGHAQTVSELVAHAASRVDQTSQAVLAKAFRGELIAEENKGES